MKLKIVFFIAFCFSNFVFGQKYFFDKVCERDYYSQEKIFVSNEYFNSKDSSYELSRYENKFVLKDNSQKKIFHLIQNEKNDFVIDYIKMITNHKDEFKINKIIVSAIENQVFLMEVFPNKKSVTPELVLKFELTESQDKLRRFYFLDVNSHIHKKIFDTLEKELDANKNFQIKKIEIDQNQQHDFLEIKKCENINLVINFQK